MLKILLVDDEPLLRLALGDALEGQGHDVTLAKDGREALEVVRGHAPLDLIVCDIHLPKVNGLDLLGVVHEERPNTPFIVMTGYGLSGDGRDAVENGAAALLTKPFEIEALFRAVAQVVEDR